MRRNEIRTAQWGLRLIAACLLAPSLSAATVIPINPNSGYYSGTFEHDNDLVFFSFSISQPDIRFQAQTLSWAQTGGFIPELTLFSAAGVSLGIGGGSSIGTYPDCGPRNIGDGGFCLDALIDAVLQPGDYLLVLSQAGNESVGDLSDGFLYDAANFNVLQECTSPDFTSNAEGCLALGGADGSGAFYWALGGQRNGSWVLSVSSVPEPASVLLMWCGVGAVVGFRRLAVRPGR